MATVRPDGGALRVLTHASGSEQAERARDGRSQLYESAELLSNGELYTYPWTPAGDGG